MLYIFLSKNLIDELPNTQKFNSIYTSKNDNRAFICDPAHTPVNSIAVTSQLTCVEITKEGRFGKRLGIRI